MNTSNHGGPRKGAGRKPVDGVPKAPISATVNADVLAAVRQIAAARHTSVSGCVEAALYDYVDKHRS
jgi:hypothetical protein